MTKNIKTLRQYATLRKLPVIKLGTISLIILKMTTKNFLKLQLRLMNFLLKGDKVYTV